MTYYTANDITPSRCTITGVYKRRDQAEGAIESDDESGMFESDETLEIGLRAVHANGCVSRAE